MRTSHVQYAILVEFMEANGDLSKPSGGPRGRHFIQQKWKDLTLKLNSDSSGDPRSEEKWRKVWSDYKNNCKKKCARINRAATGTGGGPALQLSLNDLENRVMQIVGVQAATGMAVEEAGFYEHEVSEAPQAVQDPVPQDILYEIEWNTAGTSSQPPVAPPSPPSPTRPSSATPGKEEWRPPTPKKKKTDFTKLFLETDKAAREYARERDREYDDLERERLRLRNEELSIKELEVREKVRQRDEELRLQGIWLEFLKDAMDVFVKFMERKS